MQATKTRHTGVSQRSGTDTDKRKRTVEHTGRTNGKSQKRAAINRSYANDFLKTKFETVPTIDLDPLFSENNYRYLYDSAANGKRVEGRACCIVSDNASQVFFNSLKKYVNEHLCTE